MSNIIIHVVYLYVHFYKYNAIKVLSKYADENEGSILWNIKNEVINILKEVEEEAYAIYGDDLKLPADFAVAKIPHYIPEFLKDATLFKRVILKAFENSSYCSDVDSYEGYFDDPWEGFERVKGFFGYDWKTRYSIACYSLDKALNEFANDFVDCVSYSDLDSDAHEIVEDFYESIKNEIEYICKTKVRDLERAINI